MPGGSLKVKLNYDFLNKIQGGRHDVILLIFKICMAFSTHRSQDKIMSFLLNKVIQHVYHMQTSITGKCQHPKNGHIVKKLNIWLLRVILLYVKIKDDIYICWCYSLQNGRICIKCSAMCAIYEQPHLLSFHFLLNISNITHMIWISGP